MSLYGTARRFLDGAAAAVEAAGRPAFTTVYVQVGGGALDRELMCARVMRGYRGLPSVPRVSANNCNDPGAMELTLCVLRACWPTSDDEGEPPDPAAIDAASLDLLADADAIINYALGYSAFPDGGPPDAAVGILDWMPPQGGLAGFTLAMAIPESFV